MRGNLHFVRFGAGRGVLGVAQATCKDGGGDDTQHNCQFMYTSRTRGIEPLVLNVNKNCK